VCEKTGAGNRGEWQVAVSNMEYRHRNDDEGDGSDACMYHRASIGSLGPFFDRPDRPLVRNSEIGIDDVGKQCAYHCVVGVLIDMCCTEYCIPTRMYY
jgi:hypothetical protein